MSGNMDLDLRGYGDEEPAMNGSERLTQDGEKKTACCSNGCGYYSATMWKWPTGELEKTSLGVRENLGMTEIAAKKHRYCVVTHRPTRVISQIRRIKKKSYLKN